MRRELTFGGLGAVTVLAAGYFLALTPQSASSASLREQITGLTSTNEATTERLPKLKEELTTISGQVENLKSLSARVPPAINLPELYEELGEAATKAGIPGGVTGVTISTPTLVQSTTQAGAADTTTTTTQAPSAQPSPSPSPAPSAAPQGASTTSQAHPTALASFDVNMTVSGTLDQVVTFTANLKDSTRLNVVSSSSVSVTQDGHATLQLVATYFLQQVDVAALVSQIEALSSQAAGVKNPASTTSPSRPESPSPSVASTP